MDQRHVLFSGRSVAGAQVDQRRAAGKVGDVEQLSNLIGREDEH